MSSLVDLSPPVETNSNQACKFPNVLHGHMHPIVLLAGDKTRATDDAGTAIVKSVVPTVSAGPYERQSYREPRSSIPSLIYYCLRQLIETPEQVHLLGQRRLSAQTPSQRKVIQHLTQGCKSVDGIPTEQTDPRAWAVLAQVYHDLPASFQALHIPLSDKHLPLLQEIPMTPYFHLTTVVELPRDSHVNDLTIIQFRYLPTLSYLDISGTSVTSHGLSRLSRTLTVDVESPTSRTGPWTLRALILKGCVGVKNDCISYLVNFPLLCFIDLRSTGCDSRPGKGTRFQSSPYKRLGIQNAAATLRDLASLVTSTTQVPDLSEGPISSTFWSSPTAHKLVVNKLHHPSDPYAAAPAPVKQENQVVVFAPARSSNERIKPTSHDPHILAPSSRVDHKLEGQRAAVTVTNPLAARDPPTRTAESHRLERARAGVDFINADAPWSEGQTTAAVLIQNLSVADTFEPLAGTLRLRRPISTIAPQFATTRAFYAPPEKQLQAVPARPPSQLLRSEPTDPRVLFCPPVPWSNLDAHIDRLLASRSERMVSRPSASATSMRPSASSIHAATKDVKALESMISQRRRSIIPDSTTVSAAQPPTRLQSKNPFISRNPFAQSSSRAALTLPASDLHAPSSGASKAPPIPFKPRSSLPTTSSEFSRRSIPEAVPRTTNAASSTLHASDFIDVDEIESTPPNATSSSSSDLHPPLTKPKGKSSNISNSASNSTENPKKNTGPVGLRPITKLPVPERPASVMIKSRKSTGSLPKSDLSSKSKNMDIRQSFTSTSLAQPTSSGMSKKRIRAESSSAPADRSKATSKASGSIETTAAPSVKRARSSIGEGGKSEREVVKPKASFDWNSWTGKSTK